MGFHIFHYPWVVIGKEQAAFHVPSLRSLPYPIGYSPECLLVKSNSLYPNGCGSAGPSIFIIIFKIYHYHYLALIYHYIKE